MSESMNVSAIHRIHQIIWIFWNDGRGRVLLAVSIGWALTIGTRIVYPALLPDIRTEFAFDYSITGMLVGLVWASYGLFQLPGDYSQTSPPIG